MATKAKVKDKGGRPKQLHKTDADFYEVIGGKGGKATLKNRGKDYFAKLARLSHLSRRQQPRATPAKKKSSPTV